VRWRNVAVSSSAGGNYRPRRVPRHWKHRPGVSIGFVANLVKTVTYYGYERLWDRIAWGV